ncbi:MAG: YicC/YloC family endoribonuclease, partial [Pseudomonadota bacterium]
MAARLCSMTGFARAEGAHEQWRYVWELRSVNGRGFEWRARLPAGFDSIDPELRKATKKKLTRGSLNAGLTLHT